MIDAKSVLTDARGRPDETVTLAIDEFRTRGMVKLARRSIEILDRRALETPTAG